MKQIGILHKQPEKNHLDVKKKTCFIPQVRFQKKWPIALSVTPNEKDWNMGNKYTNKDKVHYNTLINDRLLSALPLEKYKK